MAEINLEDAIMEAYGRKVPVLAGTDNGEMVAAIAGIGSSFNSNDMLELYMPDWVVKVLPSFMKGFLGELIGRYNELPLVDHIRIYGANAHNEFLKTLYNSYVQNKVTLS